jgi:hypothetical protein
MGRHRTVRIVMLARIATVVAAGLLLAACRVPTDLAAGSTTGLLPDTASAGATAPTGAVAKGTAARELAELRVHADGSMSGYSREQFGDGWETRSDHCDSRVDVLKTQGTHVVVHGCTITSGHWLSLYDGVAVTSPHLLDIDHLVPLAEAWRTGAAGWTKAQRVAFANDVGAELVAVTAHSNRSKGDDPPPSYEPPNKAEDCSYAIRWIVVKVKYRLTVTRSEHNALAAMLATCPAAK